MIYKILLFLFTAIFLTSLALYILHLMSLTPATI